MLALVIAHCVSGGGRRSVSCRGLRCLARRSGCWALRVGRGGGAAPTIQGPVAAGKQPGSVGISIIVPHICRCNIASRCTRVRLVRSTVGYSRRGKKPGPRRRGTAGPRPWALQLYDTMNQVTPPYASFAHSSILGCQATAARCHRYRRVQPPPRCRRVGRARPRCRQQQQPRQQQLYR